MKRKDFSKLQVTVQKEKKSYFEHEEFTGGTAPFLRGIYSTMYFQKKLNLTISEELPTSSNEAPEQELASFLISSFNKINKGLKENSTIDELIESIQFHTIISNNYFDEIAKMRAVRMLWAKMIKQFNPKNRDSLALNIEVSTANSFNTSIAFLGGSQSLVSKNHSYLLFEEETGITKTVDPWAGSFQLEKRTEEIAFKSWNSFKQQANL